MNSFSIRANLFFVPEFCSRHWVHLFLTTGKFSFTTQPNFEDLLMVELPGALDFHHISLKLFRISQSLPIDTLPAHYPRGPATAWRAL
ncbi:hypothetical protein BCV72DRAFT_80251 [Rhizopus microsporus var. microsporus]|uniref:Uncharacterized protein n=1 Tax=Rhizopus microsporus var. microsporus TaxID=86635 RepID=A0A1X0QNE2_RHIZD|nr:hypothetical protein BCV72DRAFT_80251 [Rhizopus microsporus var. microsporus]